MENSPSAPKIWTNSTANGAINSNFGPVSPSANAWVDLELPVAADGRYRLIVFLTQAPDYGILQFSLDGKTLGQTVDCYHADNVILTAPIDLGVVDLQGGSGRLRVEVTDSNAGSEGSRYMWGLDRLELRPVEPHAQASVVTASDASKKQTVSRLNGLFRWAARSGSGSEDRFDGSTTSPICLRNLLRSRGSSFRVCMTK